jgi:hypothetical protein
VPIWRKAFYGSDLKNPLFAKAAAVLMETSLYGEWTTIQERIRAGRMPT